MLVHSENQSHLCRGTRERQIRGAYVAEDVEGLVQGYVQHSDPFGKELVQVLPEVLKRQGGTVSLCPAAGNSDLERAASQPWAEARLTRLRPKWSTLFFFEI